MEPGARLPLAGRPRWPRLHASWHGRRDGRPGDLWSGQARGWQRWRGGGRPSGRGPLLAMLVILVVAAVVTIAALPVLAEDAPDHCTALEKRVAALLPVPGRLRGFGEIGRYGQSGARERLGWLPTVAGCTVGWWHVRVVPGAAPGWFAAMR